MKTISNKDRGFFAYCQANTRGHETRGLDISSLTDATEYVVVIPTNTLTYFKTVKSAKLSDGFKSVEKGEVDNSYKRLARRSAHMPLRDHFNGKGDCVIAIANGKLIKKDKALLKQAGATVCMTYKKYKGILEVYAGDKSLAEMANKKFKTADHKRMAMSIRTIELFAQAMNHQLVFELPKAVKKPMVKAKAQAEKQKKAA